MSLNNLNPQEKMLESFRNEDENFHIKNDK